MSRAKAQEISVIVKLYDFLLWGLPRIAKFPRDHRFVLGERMERTLYDLLDLLLEAKYSSDKRQLLARSNVLVERLRFQFRLAKDLKILAVGSYEFAARFLDAVGSEVGGWKKSLEGRP